MFHLKDITGGPRRILRKKSQGPEEPPIKFAPLVSNDNELLSNELVSSEEMGPPTSTFVTTRTRTNTKKMPPIQENNLDTVTMDSDGAMSFPLAPNSTLASNQFPLATSSTLVGNQFPLATQQNLPVATHQFPMATPSHPQTRRSVLLVSFFINYFICHLKSVYSKISNFFI